MAGRWFEALRPVCKKACLAAKSARSTDAVLFYVARWCQKKAKLVEVDPGAFEEAVLRAAADRVVRNLADDGECVERLFAGDAAELSWLRRVLLASARPRAEEAAPEYADEALQRVAVVLFAGTPPSRAATALEKGPSGPGNEYVFHAPFEFWARRIVINLVIDDRRRAARQREGPPPEKQRAAPDTLPGAKMREAIDALPALVDALPELPEGQRNALVLGLWRDGVDELVRERLKELAPELFPWPVGETFASDAEIAERLGKTPKLVAASRSLGRRRLADLDGRWALLLDQLLPHASTRPRRQMAAEGRPDG